MAKSSEIRGTWKQRCVGKLIVFLMKTLGLFVRFEVIDRYGVRKRVDNGEIMIWAMWHNTLFSAPLVRYRFSGRAPSCALASASKDGAVVASVIDSFGVRTIRGSSSRRAVAALIAMKRALQDGEQVMLTPDGPRGPVCELQPGVVSLAQKTGAQIVPLRFTHSSSWQLNSWDRFHIPKPFSKVTLDIGEPIAVADKLDKNAFEQACKQVEEALG